MKNKFIVIEGLDYVGKTTIVSLLAERLNGITYKTPPNFFQKIRRMVNLRNPKFRFYFFLTSLLLASLEIIFLKKRQHIICDRYIYTTMAYHKAAGVDVSLGFRFWEYFIFKPDRCFYLWARPEILEKRMNSRKNNSSGDMIIKNNKELREKIHENFLEFKDLFRLEFIDTSEMNPKEIVDLILKQQE